MPNLREENLGGDESGRDWRAGFRPTGGSGMACDICASLVRQDPGSSRRHLQWHADLDQTPSSGAT